MVLRERKKKETEERIRKAAGEVFKSKGYSSSTMDEIAALADISPGTLYNYYKSKAEIFLSIMTDEIDLSDEELNDFSFDLEMDVAEKVWEYIWKHLKSMLLIGKKFWREVITLVAGNFDPGNFALQGVAKLDFRFIEKIKLLLDKEKEAGLLPSSFDSGEASYAVYSVFMIQFFLYIFDDKAALETFREKARKQIEFIFEGKQRQK